MAVALNDRHCENRPVVDATRDWDDHKTSQDADDIEATWNDTQSAIDMQFVEDRGATRCRDASRARDLQEQFNDATAALTEARMAKIRNSADDWGNAEHYFVRFANGSLFH